MKEINVILLGKSGEGKSATGNSILGRSVFQISNKSEPKCSICRLECVRKDDTLIRVIDTPGFLNAESPTKSNDTLYSQAKSLCPEGIDVFILVQRFGNEFTSEDIQCLNSLKTYFGENFTRDCGILILTNCDYFEASCEQEYPSMKDWIDQTICKGKEAPLAQLLEVFNNRYVQFYNTDSLNPNKRQKSVAKLLEMIHTLTFNPSRSKLIKTESSPKQVLNIVLLGKTGNGKSATGNTILGWKAFDSYGGTGSVTKLVNLQCSPVDDIMIRVVDTPGLMDTAESNEAVLSQIVQAMSLCQEGFHALIFVLRYGNRFTKEESECLDFLKLNFGMNILKDHGIIVMTHGDNFETECGGVRTFSEWLKLGQDEKFSKIISECNNRIVLVHNQEKMCAEKRKQSRNELLRMIREDVPIPYRSEHFDTANRIRGYIENFHGPLFNRRVQECLSMLIYLIDKDIQNDTMSFEDIEAQFKKLKDAVSDYSKASNRKSLKEKLEMIQTQFEKCSSVTDRDIQKSELLNILKELRTVKDTPDSVYCTALRAFNKGARLFIKIASKAPFNRGKEFIEEKCNKIQKMLLETFQQKMLG